MRQLVATARPAIHLRAGDATDSRQRNLLHEALRLLNKHEDFLCRRFPELLLAEFFSVVSQEPAAAGHLSFDQLELMDDLQVQERIEVARIHQSAMLAADAELAELNGLICAAQGLRSVLVDHNPMRPQTYARTLRAVLSQTLESPETRLIWMQFLGLSLGRALAPLYAELSDFLRQKGVTPAAYVVMQTPVGGRQAAARAAGGPAGRTRSEMASSAVPGAMPMAAAEKLLTVDHLRRLLAGELDAEPWGPADADMPMTDFSLTVPAAFEALQEMQQVETVVHRLKQRQKGQTSDNPGGPAPGAPSVAVRDARELVRPLVWRL